MKLSTKETQKTKSIGIIGKSILPLTLIAVFASQQFKPTHVDVELVVESDIPAHIRNSSIKPVQRTATYDSFDIELYRAIIIQFEADRRGYKSENPNTHAYGLYQFMPNTAVEVYTALGFNNNSKSSKYWKLPHNQDQMFYSWTEGLIEGLKLRNVDVTYTNVWVAHNMGLRGVSEIVKYVKQGTKLPSRTVIRNMKANPPFVESNGKKLYYISYDTPMDYYYGWDVLVQHRLDKIS